MGPDDEKHAVDPCHVSQPSRRATGSGRPIRAVGAGENGAVLTDADELTGDVSNAIKPVGSGGTSGRPTQAVLTRQDCSIATGGDDVIGLVGDARNVLGLERASGLGIGGHQQARGLGVAPEAPLTNATLEPGANWRMGRAASASDVKGRRAPARSSNGSSPRDRSVTVT